MREQGIKDIKKVQLDLSEEERQLEAEVPKGQPEKGTFFFYIN